MATKIVVGKIPPSCSVRVDSQVEAAHCKGPTGVSFNNLHTQAAQTGAIGASRFLLSNVLAVVGTMAMARSEQPLVDCSCSLQ